MQSFVDKNGWTREDYEQLLRTSDACKFQPEHWLAVATYESGLKPTAKNKDGGARGLTQLMPSSLKNLGYKPGDPDFEQSQGEYTEVPISRQIVWSGKYFDSVKVFAGKSFKAWDSPGQLYLANFTPAHLPFRADMKHVLIAKDVWPTGYKANASFDTAKKNYITVQDLEDAISRAMTWKAYQVAIESLNRLLQMQLNEKGFGPLVEDGKIGPKTNAVIKAYLGPKRQDWTLARTRISLLA